MAVGQRRKRMNSFELTDEQKAVVDALRDQKQIKVNAFAGSGKTTTLLEMIRAYPRKRFLYLVFNRRNREEALEKLNREGIRNADVYTVHGYAYRHTRQFHNFHVEPNKPSTPTIKEVTGIKTLVEAALVWEIFYAWLVSEHTVFSPSVIAKIANEKGIERDMFRRVEALKAYMERHHITHDMYLKYFQINFDLLDRSNYDVVLLDEAQDSNPITLWLFNRLRARQKVLVGDIHQQIYTFRGSVNAMQTTQADVTLPLTASFRFGNDVANVANHILHLFKAETHEIQGMKTRFEKKTKAYLARTNGRLIQVMDYLGDTRWRTIRQPEEIFAAPLTILSIVKPSCKGDVQRLIGDRMYSYLYLETLNLRTFEQILEYAEEVRDAEIYQAAKIAERYDTQLLGLFELAKKKEQDKEAPIVLSTAHTAKGLEWDEVQVEDDFPDLPPLMGGCEGIDSLDHWHDLMRAADDDPAILDGDALAVVQEINLLYVAATRAAHTLIWPYQFTFQQVDERIRMVAEIRKKRQQKLVPNETELHRVQSNHRSHG